MRRVLRAPEEPASHSPGATHDLIGSTIGRYRIEELLGSGGMGEVYRAHDLVLRRDVALKRLFPAAATGEENRRRALREARAISLLNHPSIASIYDVIEFQEEILIVQELVVGMRLTDRLGEPLDLDTFFGIAAECCAALDAAAARGVVHCDLKPDNIFLAGGTRVKLLDFGISRRIAGDDDSSNLTDLTEKLVGTPAYMAPEILDGDPPTHASDLFALGVVFYQLLTGKHPFRRSTLTATISAVIREEPDPPSVFNRAVPSGLDELVLRMLAKDPRQRVATPDELAARLERLRSGAVQAVRSRVGGLHLAVKPFESQTVDPAVTFFAAGMMETVQVRLASLQGVHVVSADELDSPLSLEGSVQRSQERLRIRYRLLDHRQGLTLGGDVVEGDVNELFDLEDRVTEGVARLLVREFGLAPMPGRLPRPTADVSAYDLYLQARGYLGRFERKENIDIAIDLFEKALAKDSGFPLALAGLGEAFWKRFEDSRDPQWAREAERRSLEALRMEPALAEVRVTLGLVYVGTGRIADAVREFRRATELDPRSDAAWRGLARAEEGEGRLDSAEQTYLRAIEARPDYWAGHNDLGVFYFRHARYQKALTSFSRVVELTPDNARGYSNLGGTYQTMGLLDEAVAAHGRSLELHPNHRAFSNLATIYHRQGRYAEAATTYERALTLDPGDYRIWGSLAATYRQIPGKAEEAESTFRRAASLAKDALDINPSDALTTALLAQYHGELGRLDEARLLVKRALCLAPHDAEVMFHLIPAMLGLGNRDGAIEMLREAIAAGYSLEAARDQRAAALAELADDPRFGEILGETPAPAPESSPEALEGGVT